MYLGGSAGANLGRESNLSSANDAVVTLLEHAAATRSLYPINISSFYSHHHHHHHHHLLARENFIWGIAEF